MTDENLSDNLTLGELIKELTLLGKGPARPDDLTNVTRASVGNPYVPHVKVFLTTTRTPTYK